MDTGADNYDEMRWVLRAIKKEQSLTPAGENVKIDIDQLTKRDPDAPALDTVRKCIRILDSQSAFRVEKKYIDVPFDPYDPVDATWERAKNFELAIKQDLFDAVCGGYENPVGPIDLKSDDAVYLKEEKAKIGAIKHSKDHKIEQEKWLEIKSILDGIGRQLSPMATGSQTVSIKLNHTHSNISESLLRTLWNRKICTDSYGSQIPEFRLMYNRNGSLIVVRDVDLFNNYRNGVSDFVKWIEQDAVRFSKTSADVITPAPQNAEIQSLQAQTDVSSGDKTTEDYLVTVAPNRAAELLTLLDEFHDFRNDKGRLELYAKFIRWDLDVGKALRKLKNLDYCNDWLSVKSFFPKNRMYEFPSGTKALRYPPLDELLDDNGQTPEEKKEQIMGDFNELRLFMKEKLAILRKYKDNEGGKHSEQTDVQQRVASTAKSASDLPLASQRKLKLLEILKDEWELTPKTGIKIGKAANLIDHPAGVCKIHFDTFTEKWIPRALLDSPEQLENLLTLFMTEGLIRWRRLDNNETIIEIKFPEDFESRYESYTSQILGSKGNAKAAELGNKTEVGGEKVSAQSTNNSVSSVASKPTMNLAKSAPSAPKKESTVGNPPFATKPEFDDKKSRIIWNGQYCEIPINKNSYFFCKKMFESTFGEKVSELDISEQDSWDNDSTRSVYFAMQWVNKLLKDGYGIGEDLFKARTNHYSIRDELFKLS